MSLSPSSSAVLEKPIRASWTAPGDEFEPSAALPYRTVATARTFEGQDMVLQEHEGSYFLYLGGEMLMGGKYHGSEEDLGTLGCQHLKKSDQATVLIGGLGMGFTLRTVLDALGSDSRIISAELSEAIIRWNCEDGPLAEAAHFPMGDPRSQIDQRDLCEIIKTAAPSSYDAILIDTDNEPQALSYKGNNHLYTKEGLIEIHRALKPEGRLGFWFLRAPDEFDHLLNQAGFSVERHAVSSGEGAHHLIIIASPRNNRGNS